MKLKTKGAAVAQGAAQGAAIPGLPELVREIMAAHPNITQCEATLESGLCYKTFLKIKRGDPSLTWSTIQQFFSVFGVELAVTVAAAAAVEQAVEQAEQTEVTHAEVTHANSNS